MLIPRIIPSLLLQEDAIVKTTKFKSPRYIGDPINTVNLFNRFEVDELIVLDIDATRKKQKPNFEIIEQICNETFMPLTYGGGVHCLDDMKKLFTLGVEKVVLGTAAYTNPQLVRDAVAKFGSQAVVASVDYKTSMFGVKSASVTNAKVKVKIPLEEYLSRLVSLGVGEIIMHSIERDGTMIGYDIDTIRSVSQKVSVPLVALGGAKTRDCLPKIICDADASAAAASSIFIYQNEERGILINFPERHHIDNLLGLGEIHATAD